MYLFFDYAYHTMIECYLSLQLFLLQHVENWRLYISQISCHHPDTLAYLNIEHLNQ